VPEPDRERAEAAARYPPAAADQLVEGSMQPGSVHGKVERLGPAAINSDDRMNPGGGVVTSRFDLAGV
jgi:hypothetical protein